MRIEIEIENEVIKDKNLLAFLECLRFIYYRVKSITQMLETYPKITAIEIIKSDLRDMISTLRAFSLAEQADDLNEIAQTGQQKRFDFILEKMKQIKDNVDGLTVTILSKEKKEKGAELLLQLLSMRSLVSYIQKWLQTFDLAKKNYSSDTEVRIQNLLFSLRKSSEKLRCLFSGNKKNTGDIQALNTLNYFEQCFTYKAELLYTGKHKTIYNFFKEEGEIGFLKEMHEMLNKLKVDFINQNNDSIGPTNVKIIIETIIEMKQTISNLILDTPQEAPKIEKNL